MYLEAHEVRKGRVAQVLRLTMVDTKASSKNIDPQAIRDLVVRLREAVLRDSPVLKTDVVPFSARSGYYFSFRHRDGGSVTSEGFAEEVVGALKKDGYLINITVLTAAADSVETRGILAAIDRLRIK